MYWQSNINAKPTWFDPYQWKWAQEGELSKLLGTTFGLSLEVQDVDNSLFGKQLEESHTLGIKASFFSESHAYCQSSSCLHPLGFLLLFG